MVALGCDVELDFRFTSTEASLGGDTSALWENDLLLEVGQKKQAHCPGSYLFPRGRISVMLGFLMTWSCHDPMNGESSRRGRCWSGVSARFGTDHSCSCRQFGSTSCQAALECFGCVWQRVLTRSTFIGIVMINPDDASFTRSWSTSLTISLIMTSHHSLSLTISLTIIKHHWPLVLLASPQPRTAQGMAPAFWAPAGRGWKRLKATGGVVASPWIGCFMMENLIEKWMI